MESTKQDVSQPSWFSSSTAEYSDLFNIITELDTSEDIMMNIPSTVTDISEDEDEVATKPYVKIVEEPASNLYRFRYRSEGETAGIIPGEKQQNGRKSFPKILVCNHDGLAAVEVCCLTEDLRVHPNKLVWRQGGRGSTVEEVNAGIYKAEIRGNTEEEIKVGVTLSRKNDVLNLLSDKQELGVDPYGQGYSHVEDKARKEVDLTCVRLCYTVTVQQGDGSWLGLPPVHTQVIQHNMVRSELRIRDISDTSSSSAGGEKKILICDKLDPTGLQLVFHDELSGWTGFGEFSPGDVHNKSCAVFTTPAYPLLGQVTTVMMEMNKVDGSAASSPVLFTYHPQKDGHLNTAKHPKCRRHSEPKSGQRSNFPSSRIPALGSLSTYTYQDIL